MPLNTEQTKCDKCDERAVFLTTGEQYCVAHAPLTLDAEQTWEKRFDLALAQAAPITMMGFYKDADFSVIKSFIRTELANARTQALREAVEIAIDNCTMRPRYDNCAAVLHTLLNE